jgi:hypothetical protein
MKFDSYLDLDAQAGRNIAKALRYIAHSNVASLVFCSKDEDALIAKLKLCINNQLFGSKPSKQIQIDYPKPVFIPVR